MASARTKEDIREHEKRWRKNQHPVDRIIGNEKKDGVNSDKDKRQTEIKKQDGY